MKNPLIVAGVLAFALSGIGAARAVIATGLSSFEGIEEPSVRFIPKTGQFEPDHFVNTTDVGDRTVRMYLRYNAEWWDGDRDTTNKDRQRAEVKGLGPHQKHGETFEYTTTWRTNPEFKGSDRFCHIFQLKATNGDNGAPLVVLSILEGTDDACVRFWPGNSKGFIEARRFHWKPGVWQTVTIRIKTSPNADGEVSASVDGDAFQGKTGIAVDRPDADDYRPKWGLYRGVKAGMSLGNDYVEHKEPSAKKVANGKSVVKSSARTNSSADDNVALEIEAVRQASGSRERGLSWLLAQSDSPARNFELASAAAAWAEVEPADAMNWAEHLEGQELRLDAIQRIFNRWLDTDLAAAIRWLVTRAPNPELDPLVWYLVTDTTYRYVNRSIALDNAPLITDPGLRARSIEHVVMIWSRQSSEAAAKFVSVSPALDAGQKDAILKKIRERPQVRGPGET